MKRSHHTEHMGFGSEFGRFHHDNPSEHGPSGQGHGDGDGHGSSGHGQGRGRGRGFGRGPGFGPGSGGGFGPGGGGFGPAFEPGFGPGGMRGGRGSRRASKGDVRSAILSLLGEGSSNGYGLIRAIEEKTGGAWRPSPGSVYPTLQQLVDEELITSTGDGRRTDYELTETGTAYLVEHADELKKAWDATPGQSDADAAFHESAGKLMGVIHQFRFSATDAQRTAAIEKLDEARRALYLILAD